MRSEMGTKALTEHVSALRCGLDHTLHGEGAERCDKAVRARAKWQYVDGRLVKIGKIAVISQQQRVEGGVGQQG